MTGDPIYDQAREDELFERNARAVAVHAVAILYSNKDIALRFLLDEAETVADFITLGIRR